MKKYGNILKTILSGFNILNEKAIEVAEKLLNHPQTQNQIFELIFKDFLKMDRNESVFGLLHHEGNEINLCGLLSGKLMTGKKIAEIAEKCLESMKNNPNF